jgi:hypothetical protein
MRINKYIRRDKSMNNNNFTLQSSFEANYLNIRLDELAQMDDIAVNVIMEDCPDFIIPFRIVNINDSVTLKYKLINTVALEYMDTTLNKYKFIKLYMNLLTPFIKGNDWFLNYHQFCIDTRYVFLDKASGVAHYIYVPEYSYSNTDEEIFGFFKAVFNRITITDDANFQVRLYQYFARNNVTLADLYNLFVEENRHINGSSDNNRNVQAAPQVNIPQPANSSPQQPNANPQPALQPQNRQPVQPTPADNQAYIPQPATDNKPKNKNMDKNPEKKKSGGFGSLFGGDKDKDKSKADNSFLESSGISFDVPEQDSDDEVMKALFGDKNKKSKENSKKSSGFNLFGKKKEDTPVSSVQQDVNVVPQQRVQQTPYNAAEYNQPVNQSFQSYGIGYNQDSGDSTEIYSDDAAMPSGYLELIDSPIQGAVRRIDLGFQTPYITIGRTSSDEVQPDVAFSREFSRIGRRHARIEKREGAYFVIDLGSANHTLLNGTQLIPNQPYQLNDGGELTFTDSKPVRYRIHL